MVVLIVISVVMFALGVLLLMGKADKFIAGYNTANEEERKQINIKRLRLVVAVCLWVTTAVCVLVLPNFPKHGMPGVDALIIMGIFSVIAIVTVILANTWCKKKAKN